MKVVCVELKRFKSTIVPLVIKKKSYMATLAKLRKVN